MPAALRLDDERIWTPDALRDSLPADVDWRRFEIVDGVLVVGPPALPRHDLLVMEIGIALRPALPAGYRVLGAVGIELGRSYRVTDVTVVAEHVFRSDRGTVSPSDVLLAVEIESPSSITTDRITKPAQYAGALIENYWRVETDPLRLTAYRLAGGAYEATGSWSSEEVAVVGFGAATVEIDLGALLPA